MGLGDQGTESSRGDAKKNSFQKAVSGLYHDSWDFEKADKSHDASGHNTSGHRTASRTASVVRSEGDRSTWSFAVMDYNDLDAEYELPVTGSRGARWWIPGPCSSLICVKHKGFVTALF